MNQERVTDKADEMNYEVASNDEMMNTIEHVIFTASEFCAFGM